MSYAAALMARSIRRVLYVQAMLTVAVAAGFGFGSSDAPPIGPAWLNGLSPASHQVLSAAYGGAVAMLSTWWLGWRINRAGEVGRQQPAAGSIALYAGLFQRLIGTVVLLALGFAGMRLAPLPLVAAYAAAQFGFVAANSRERRGA